MTRQHAEVSELLLKNLALTVTQQKKLFRRRKHLEFLACARRLQRLRTALKALAVTVFFLRRRRARRVGQQRSFFKFLCRRICQAWREYRVLNRRHARALVVAESVVSMRVFRNTQRFCHLWYACTADSASKRRRASSARETRALRDTTRCLSSWQHWCMWRIRARGIVGRFRMVWRRALLAHVLKVYAWEVKSTYVAREKSVAKEALIKCETAEIEQHLAKSAMLANRRSFLSEKRQFQEELELAKVKAQECASLSSDNKRLRNKLMASQRLCGELHLQVASERARGLLCPPPLSPRETHLTHLTPLERNLGCASVRLSEGGGGLEGGCGDGGGDSSRGERGGAEAEFCTLGPAAALPSAPPPTRASSEAAITGSYSQKHYL
jgi:hypothetical protein